jgi:hypothetical protein
MTDGHSRSPEAKWRANDSELRRLQNAPGLDREINATRIDARMTDKPNRNSTGLLATAVAVLLVLEGCSPKVRTVTTQNIVTVESGMTIQEVDREIGSPGDAVEFNALPKVFQQKVSGKDGMYRKWTKTDDKSTITVFAEIKDGKIAGSTYADARFDSTK